MHVQRGSGSQVYHGEEGKSFFVRCGYFFPDISLIDHLLKINALVVSPIARITQTMSGSSDESTPGTPPHRAPPRRGRYSDGLPSYVKRNVTRAAAAVAAGGVASAASSAAAKGGGAGEAGGSSSEVERVKLRMLLGPGEDGRSAVSDWIANPHTPGTKVIWSWNIAICHLKLNQRRNMRTSKTKTAGWFWLPLDTTAIFEMQDTFVGSAEARSSYTPGMTTNVRRNPNSFYRTTKFQYRLVPLPTMNSPTFTDLPPVTSRVPPHFVVVDTGKKLSQLYDSHTGAIAFERDFAWISDSATQDMMTAMQRIYLAWMGVKLERRWLEGGREDGEEEEDYSG
ncbi:unnamed protein product [Cyclocybe aegerita]|uniref:Uncharacterized protein n=1 Tax=Cyclocybe aegerita TaxID=1973307 RepID=A0A8S0W767_CYCAE|nr:unnamed protein product [Cyclocybe aegerita]